MMTTVTAPKTGRRKAPRAARRQQLIDATMKCIARKGMGSTTLADVAREAGLSQGIVNLHFKSKENLLNETLQFLADEYKAQFEKALRQSEKLLALPDDLTHSMDYLRHVALLAHLEMRPANWPSNKQHEYHLPPPQ